MSIAVELLEAFEKLHGQSIEEEVERLGVLDHNGLRLFGQVYGTAIAGIEEDRSDATPAEALGASVIAGFLLGLDYAQRHRLGIEI